MALGIPTGRWVPSQHWGSLEGTEIPSQHWGPQAVLPSQLVLEVLTQCWSPWLVLGVLSQHLWSPVSPGRPPDGIEVPAGIGVQLVFTSRMMFAFPSTGVPDRVVGVLGGIRVSPVCTGVLAGTRDHPVLGILAKAESSLNLLEVPS